MEIRSAANPRDVKNYDTNRLREEFLIQELFIPDKYKLIYSHVERIIVGGVCPKSSIKLEVGEELKADYFLQRRELGVINVGGKGTVNVDGTQYSLEPNDGLYIGMGSKDIEFSSKNSNSPAKFYLNSAPAHTTFPTEKIEISTAAPVKLGSSEESNQRTIYKYIHPEGVKSCQLVMGMTILEPGSVWNTMPCHTHDRRMEVYFYFNIDKESLVFHFMGEPFETRHLVIRNEEAVISPSWSIHSGCGTKNYTFIWGMAGENQAFTDMDVIKLNEMR